MYTIRDGSGDERLSSTSFYIFASRLSSRSVIRTRLPSIIHFYPIQRFLYIRTYITAYNAFRLTFRLTRRLRDSSSSFLVIAYAQDFERDKVSRLHRHRYRHRHKDKYTRGRKRRNGRKCWCRVVDAVWTWRCPMSYALYYHTYIWCARRLGGIERKSERLARFGSTMTTMERISDASKRISTRPRCVFC